MGVENASFDAKLATPAGPPLTAGAARRRALLTNVYVALHGGAGALHEFNLYAELGLPPPNPGSAKRVSVDPEPLRSIFRLHCFVADFTMLLHRDDGGAPDVLSVEPFTEGQLLHAWGSLAGDACVFGYSPVCRGDAAMPPKVQLEDALATLGVVFKEFGGVVEAAGAKRYRLAFPLLGRETILDLAARHVLRVPQAQYRVTGPGV
jgi:hypothetical protein